MTSGDKVMCMIKEKRAHGSQGQEWGQAQHCLLKEAQEEREATGACQAECTANGTARGGKVWMWLWSRGESRAVRKRAHGGWGGGYRGGSETCSDWCLKMILWLLCEECPSEDRTWGNSGACGSGLVSAY